MLKAELHEIRKQMNAGGKTHKLVDNETRGGTAIVP